MDLRKLAEHGMAWPFVCVALTGAYLTYKTRCVQVRAVPRMLRLLTARAAPADAHGITPRAALLTAMSTTLGVGTVVGPVLAIGLGGPGALVAYVIATFLGGATIFCEVALALRFGAHKTGGGPMQYVRALSPAWARVYAAACALLLLGWTAANANTMAMTLGLYAVPRTLAGALLAVGALAVLQGGIARVARMNRALVPAMCVLYCAATGWIIFVAHGDAVPAIVRLVVASVWRPEAVGYGVGVASVAQVLRHGLARALQANEAGVGISSIPHGMAAGDAGADHAMRQATLAMAAAWFNGFLCLLTGMTVLVAGPFAPDTVFDVTLLNRIFVDHLSATGGMVLSVSMLLFAFGTIVGNCFNGARCAAFLRAGGARAPYYAAAAVAIVLGACHDFAAVLAWTDALIVPVLLINCAALVIWAAQGAVTEGAMRQTPPALPAPGASRADVGGETRKTEIGGTNDALTA